MAGREATADARHAELDQRAAGLDQREAAVAVQRDQALGAVKALLA